MPYNAEVVSPSIALRLLFFRNRKQLHPIMLAQEQQAMVARFSMLQQQNYNAVRRKKRLARLAQRLAERKRQEEMIREWKETFEAIATWNATGGAKSNKKQREQSDVDRSIEESADIMSIDRLELYSYLTAKFGGSHGIEAEKSRNRNKSRSFGRKFSRMQSDNSNPSSYKGRGANRRSISSSDGSVSSSGSAGDGLSHSDSDSDNNSNSNSDSDSDMSTSHMGSSIVHGLSST
jgi:hypothetical protein